MPIDAVVDARGFVRLTFAGAWPSIPELRNMRQALEDPGASRLVLADLRPLSENLPHTDDIRSLVARVAGSAGSAARRRAILVATDVQFGVARIFQSLLPGEVEVFRDEAAAVAWLLAGSAAS